MKTHKTMHASMHAAIHTPMHPTIHTHCGLNYLRALTLALRLSLNLIPPQAQAAAVLAVAPLSLKKCFNLVGNGPDATLDVGTLFADQSRFVMVWKWDAVRGGWSFYAPSLAAQGGTALTDYAKSKDYQVLTTINGGEGFWVNASLATSVSMPGGNPIRIAALAASMVRGFNLAALGESATPKQFCNARTSGVITLWAWHATRAAWYFYAPSLIASNGLTPYTAGKEYLDFAAAGKLLQSGIGFWANRQ